MAMYKKIVLAQVVAIAVFCLLAVGVQSEPDIRPVHYACYGQLDPVSLNQDSVQAVRDDLIDNTVGRGFNFYNTDQFPGGAWCYGNAICRLRIPAEDCITRMIVVATVLLHACRFPGTPDLALMDCRFRWQFNTFID